MQQRENRFFFFFNKYSIYIYTRFELLMGILMGIGSTTVSKKPLKTPLT